VEGSVRQTTALVMPGRPACLVAPTAAPLPKAPASAALPIPVQLPLPPNHVMPRVVITLNAANSKALCSKKTDPQNK